MLKHKIGSVGNPTPNPPKMAVDRRVHLGCSHIIWFVHCVQPYTKISNRTCLCMDTYFLLRTNACPPADLAYQLAMKERTKGTVVYQYQVFDQPSFERDEVQQREVVRRAQELQASMVVLENTYGQYLKTLRYS